MKKCNCEADCKCEKEEVNKTEKEVNKTEEEVNKTEEEVNQTEEEEVKVKECKGKEKKNETKELLEEANNKIKELEEALLRTKADNINYRKRLEDEQARLLKFANEGLVKEILPIIDNFERAIKFDVENEDPELAKLLEGFKMVYCSLIEVLNKYSVKEIEVLNKPYDAANAQAVIQEPKDGVEPGIVIEVFQKGYELKGKVIRPAMVKVSA